MEAAHGTTSLLEYLLRMARGETPVPPVADLLGFRPSEVRPGKVTIIMEAGPQHASPLGTVHGGVICAIADAAMGLAYASTLKEGETFATVELKINFLRPVWQGWLKAKGKVVNSGRTLGLVECDVTDQEQRLIARGLSTCMTLREVEAAIPPGQPDTLTYLQRKPKP